jgi:hypothetical protein
LRSKLCGAKYKKLQDVAGVLEMPATFFKQKIGQKFLIIGGALHQIAPL